MKEMKEFNETSKETISHLKLVRSFDRSSDLFRLKCKKLYAYIRITTSPNVLSIFSILGAFTLSISWPSTRLCHMAAAL